MRLALAAVLLLSACGARAGSGVGWPKMAERESDGGESLAPHPGAVALASAAAADDDDDDDDIKVVSSGTDDAKPAAASSAGGADDATSSDDDTPITIDDIVIEIDDD